MIRTTALAGALLAGTAVLATVAPAQAQSATDASGGTVVSWDHHGCRFGVGYDHVSMSNESSTTRTFVLTTWDNPSIATVRRLPVKPHTVRPFFIIKSKGDPATHFTVAQHGDRINAGTVTYRNTCG